MLSSLKNTSLPMLKTKKMIFPSSLLITIFLSIINASSPPLEEDTFIFHKLKLLQIEFAIKDKSSSYEERSTLYDELQHYEKIPALKKRVFYLRGLFARYGNYSRKKFNNLQDSFDFFTKCSKEPNSFPPCNYELAVAYERGYGCAVDFHKAKQFYLRNPDDVKSLHGLIRINAMVSSLRNTIKSEIDSNILLDSEIILHSLLPTQRIPTNEYFSYARSALSECLSDDDDDDDDVDVYVDVDVDDVDVSIVLPPVTSLEDFLQKCLENILNPLELSKLLLHFPSHKVDGNVIKKSIVDGCSLEIISMLMDRYSPSHDDDDVDVNNEILISSIQRGDFAIFERLLDGDSINRGAIDPNNHKNILEMAVLDLRVLFIQKLLSDKRFTDIALLRSLKDSLSAFSEHYDFTSENLVNSVIHILKDKIVLMEKKEILSKKNLDIRDIWASSRNFKAIVILSFLISKDPSIAMKDNIMSCLTETDIEKIEAVLGSIDYDSLIDKIQACTAVDSLIRVVNDYVKDIPLEITSNIGHNDKKYLTALSLLKEEDIAKIK